MKVKLYVNSSDPYSGMVENILKYNNVDFERIEISRSLEKLDELEKVSGQTSTPVIVVNGKAFIGFDHEMIKEVLNLTKK
jgi:glutaredoxin